MRILNKLFCLPFLIYAQEFCDDLHPPLLCIQIILTRHNEGPCHRLSRDHKDLCKKTCGLCRGPGCQDDVMHCDQEFIPQYYNCELLVPDEQKSCKRSCRLCPDQYQEKQVKTPYGWQHSVDAYEGSVGYAEEYSEDYPSYSEDYVSYPDPTQPSYEVNLLPKFDYHPLANNLGNNQPPQQNAPTNGPNPDFVATTLTPKPTESNNDHEKKVNDQDPVPIHPIQPGIFVMGPSGEEPLLMPLWLPLWMVILIGLGIFVLTAFCCCCCFRFKIWQIRIAHYRISL